MTKDGLAQLQQENQTCDLTALAMMCRARFLRAAGLVELRSGPVDELWRLGISDDIDVSRLLLAWQSLCDRYLRERYDAHLSFFESPESQQAKAWSQFVNHHLHPHLVRDDEFVRNVLRALDRLPANSPSRADEDVRLYLTEMTLPENVPPSDDESAARWASLDRLAAEIGARWPAGVSAAAAVAEARR